MNLFPTNQTNKVIIMNLNFGPLRKNDADVLLDFLKSLRGVKKQRGDKLNVPLKVLEIVDLDAWRQTFKAQLSTLPGILCIKQGFQVHGAHTRPARVPNQLVVELDIEYETEFG